ALDVLAHLERAGASFVEDIAAGGRRLRIEVEEGLCERVPAALVTGDGSAGLRSLLHSEKRRRPRPGRPTPARPSPGTGRWSRLAPPAPPPADDLVAAPAPPRPPPPPAWSGPAPGSTPAATGWSSVTSCSGSRASRPGAICCASTGGSRCVATSAAGASGGGSGGGGF